MQKKYFLFLIFAFLLQNINIIVYAKQVNTKKQMHIEAEQMFYDDRKQVKIFTGNVIFRCDTLFIQANKAILTTDSTGYEFIVLYAALGKLVIFRQKFNDYSNFLIKGQAKRIEYSEKTGISKLFSHASMQRINYTKIIDAIHGECISYNSRTGFYFVKSNFNTN